jgi:hypothetical protein
VDVRPNAVMGGLDRGEVEHGIAALAATQVTRDK